MRVFARPAHAYTRALLAAVPQLGSMADQTLPQPFPIQDPVTGAASPLTT